MCEKKVIENIQSFNNFAPRCPVFEEKDEPFHLENASNLTHKFF